VANVNSRRAQDLQRAADFTVDVAGLGHQGLGAEDVVQDGAPVVVAGELDQRVGQLARRRRIQPGAARDVVAGDRAGVAHHADLRGPRSEALVPARRVDATLAIEDRVRRARGGPSVGDGLAHRAVRADEVLAAELGRAAELAHQVGHREQVARRRVAIDPRHRLAAQVGERADLRVLARDDRRLVRGLAQAAGDGEHAAALLLGLDEGGRRHPCDVERARRETVDQRAIIREHDRHRGTTDDGGDPRRQPLAFAARPARATGLRQADPDRRL
jgi:hypothetical protein